jgi:leader peptidase (prepilin peptidase) / N-methyltransferase
MFLQFFLFFLGAALGSFLNVVILRYKPHGAVFGKQLGGRSGCVSCGKILHWYELIPIVSFFVQLGRCRGCGKPISAQYPIVELLSGTVMATLPMIMGLTTYSFIWVAAIFVLITISFIDIRNYLIPDILTILLFIIGVVLTWFAATGKLISIALIPGTFLGGYAYVFSFTQNVWVGHFAAAAILGLFFSAIILLSKGRAMGWGDAKLATAIGMLLGWPDAICSIMIAFIIGAFAGGIFLAVEKKTLKDALPFGPFLAAGSIIVIYFGYDLMTLYFKFLNLGA